MKFRRRSANPEPEQSSAADDTAPEDPVAAAPRDSSQVTDEEEFVDLGSLRLPPLPEREVRLQVDDKTGEVQAVLIVGAKGAMEVRAFAAPRNGDLWNEIRPKIAAETQQAGGKVAQRDGRFGPELLCQRPATGPDGEEGVTPSRVVGVNGERWMLRATFLGDPALQPETYAEWEDTLASVVVHRGSEAKAVGEALPLQLPPDARRAQ